MNFGWICWKNVVSFAGIVVGMVMGKEIFILFFPEWIPWESSVAIRWLFGNGMSV